MKSATKKRAPKVKTDKKLIDKFLTRGVENIFPSKEMLREKLLLGERIKVYQGFDPTGPYLHVGHAMGIRGLRILQQLGHEVIFLVGDYTSKVGDPDKDTTRKMLTDEEIHQNMQGWKKQAEQLIDFGGGNPVRFDHNYRWLSKLKMEDLIKLMSNITVQRMIERDLFERRLKEGDPIRLHEFIYPLMQGYDSVAMEVDLEMGGSDQTFNMLVGRDLVKNYLGKEKFVRTNKMMDAPDARTMSKTKGNGINLADTPGDMFGKAMSYPDSAILTGFELLTDVPEAEIKEMEQAMKKGENPMQFKKLLAFEIVKVVKGQKSAETARANFEKVFSKGETPAEMPEIETGAKVNLLAALQKCFAKEKKSNSDLKRLIKQKAVKVDGKVIADPNQGLKVPEKGLVVKAGKISWFRLTR